MRTPIRTALARSRRTAISTPAGRGGGLEVGYPFAWSSTVALAPYEGLYGDYYFSMDDAAVVGITTVPLLQGCGHRSMPDCRSYRENRRRCLPRRQQGDHVSLWTRAVWRFESTFELCDPLFQFDNFLVRERQSGL